MGKEVILQENENAGSFLITVPKHLVDLKSWEKGDKLKFELKNGDVIISEV